MLDSLCIYNRKKIYICYKSIHTYIINNDINFIVHPVDIIESSFAIGYVLIAINYSLECTMEGGGKELQVWKCENLIAIE